MTREEREKHLDWLYRLKSEIFVFMPKDWMIPFADALDVAIKAIEQEPTKNDLGVDCISRAQAQTEIEMNASRYTIAKERGGMGQVEWSDQLIKVSDAVDIIRNLSPVTPQEPFINKPCLSEKQCEHDKNIVLNKIRAEIEKEADACNRLHGISEIGLRTALKIIDKYKGESEG